MRVDSILPVVAMRLATVGRETPLTEVGAVLGRPGQDMVVVCDGAGFALGVITRTDAVRHFVSEANQHLPADAMIAGPMIACSVEDDLMTVLRNMQTRRLHNLPVVNGRGLPVGILAAADALAALLTVERDQETSLVDYITGIGYR